MKTQRKEGTLVQPVPETSFPNGSLQQAGKHSRSTAHLEVLNKVSLTSRESVEKSPMQKRAAVLNSGTQQAIVSSNKSGVSSTPPGEIIDAALKRQMPSKTSQDMRNYSGSVTGGAAAGGQAGRHSGNTSMADNSGFNLNSVTRN